MCVSTLKLPSPGLPGNSLENLLRFEISAHCCLSSSNQAFCAILFWISGELRLNWRTFCRWLQLALGLQCITWSLMIRTRLFWDILGMHGDGSLEALKDPALVWPRGFLHALGGSVRVCTPKFWRPAQLGSVEIRWWRQRNCRGCLHSLINALSESAALWKLANNQFCWVSPLIEGAFELGNWTGCPWVYSERFNFPDFTLCRSLRSNWNELENCVAWEYLFWTTWGVEINSVGSC